METLVLPSLGPKLVGIRSVNVLAAMHGVDTIAHPLAGRHENGGPAIPTTANRQHGVADDLAGVDRDGGV